MTKAASHPHISAAPEHNPPPKQAPKSVEAEENYPLYEARCMLQLLEDLTQDVEHDVTVSRQAFAVMMGVIREKMVFSP
ncbi:hypothetical protein [Glaciimonas sp. GG7]